MALEKYSFISLYAPAYFYSPTCINPLTHNLLCIINHVMLFNSKIRLLCIISNKNNILQVCMKISCVNRICLGLVCENINKGQSLNLDWIFLVLDLYFFFNSTPSGYGVTTFFDFYFSSTVCLLTFILTCILTNASFLPVCWK